MAAVPISMATGDTQLEEVIVTAQKRSENLQSTPVAVTALSADALAEQNVLTTYDLMQVTPGLEVSTQAGSNAGGSAVFFLRGMGQERSGNGSEPAVGIYVDNIYYPSLNGTIFNILDLQQVEVLRGPQGTYFGRNTIGGAITYTTMKPTDQFQASVSAAVGSFGRNDLTGLLNLPLTDIVEVRLTAGRLQTSGYVRQQDGGAPAGGTETELGRIQVRIKPADSLTIDVGAGDSRQYLDGFSYSTPAPFGVGPLFPAWWNANPLHADDLYDSRYVSQCSYCQAGSGAHREFSETHTPTGTVAVDWNIAGDLTVKSFTGWTRVENSYFNDLDETPLPIFENYQSSTDTATSEEIQVNDRNFDNRLVWVGGLYYYHEYSVVSPTSYVIEAFPPPKPGIPLQLVGLPTTVPTSGATRTTDSYAAYLNGTYQLFDKFSLLGGFRYSRDDKSATEVGFDSIAKDFSSNTWMGGVQYQLTPDIMTYGKVSTGYRAGGFNPPSAGVPPVQFIPFNPEKDTSYEIGARMDFFDRRLRLNPTAFYTNWTDIQVQSALPLLGQGIVIVLQNAGKARTSGFELEWEAQLMRNLKLFGNVATLSTRYESLGTASGITLNSEFAMSPTLTYAAGAMYTYDLPDAKLRSSLNWSWRASQWSNPADADKVTLPSYGILNARIEYAADKHWSVALTGSNLLDKLYSVGGVNYGACCGTALYDLGRPREWGLTGRYSY